MLPFEFKKKERYTSVLASIIGQKLLEIAGWRKKETTERQGQGNMFHFSEKEKVQCLEENIARSGVRQSWFWFLVVALSDSITSVSLSARWEDSTTCLMRELKILSEGTYNLQWRRYRAWDTFIQCRWSPLFLVILPLAFSQMTGYLVKTVEVGYENNFLEQSIFSSEGVWRAQYHQKNL